MTDHSSAATGSVRPGAARRAARARRDEGRALICSAELLHLLDLIEDTGCSLTELREGAGLEPDRFERLLRQLLDSQLISTSAGTISLTSAVPGVVFAADIGGTKVRAAIADRRGRVLAEVSVPTDCDNVVAQVAYVHAQLCDVAGLNPAATLAASIGIPASYDAVADRAWNCANIPALAQSRPMRDLSAVLGMPVSVAQDVRLAVVAERWRGWGRSEDDFVVVCLGTGVAMGILLDGELYAGGRGAAGEMGMLPLGTDPFDPVHQRRGPFEDFVSGPSLAERWMRLQGLPDGGKLIHAGAVFTAAEQGDPLARQVLDEHGRVLALGIAAVIASLDPAVVVLSGGLGTNPALIGTVRDNLSRLMTNAPPLQVSPLNQNGPLLGAVAVAATLSFNRETAGQ
jgi:glucokinase